MCKLNETKRNNQLGGGRNCDLFISRVNFSNTIFVILLTLVLAINIVMFKKLSCSVSSIILALLQIGVEIEVFLLPLILHALLLKSVLHVALSVILKYNILHLVLCDATILSIVLCQY